MRVSALFSGLWLIVAAGVSYAGEAHEWIDKMSQAGQANNFEGVFIYWNTARLESMRIQHSISKDGVWESLESLNGEFRKVVRNEIQIASIFPDRQLMSLRRSEGGSPYRPQIPQNTEALSQYYDMSVLGESRVAGWNAVVVAVEPKDQYRYGFRYWVEKNSGMMLQCDVLNEKDHVVERTMFTELRFLNHEPLSGSKEIKAPEGYKVVVLDEPQDVHDAKDILWRAEILPPGFVLTKSMIKSMHQGHNRVRHMMYSDGMATVSVFIEKNDSSDKEAFRGVSTLGAVNAFGRIADGYHVTVVGEVPLDTVSTIGASLRKIK